MDMTSGARLTDAERYGEEVLNANWLPQAALGLGLQTVSETSVKPRTPQVPALTDIDGFMSRLYSSQE
ncbi:hypothetical protein VVD49_03215 [Uliginosibacterium sp. H3]|uniref:Uncharacterized protein n=1 Tax=Uliginosibacterium silvisoli TaxID=3114758 RepID=A0ABU6JZD5_9RHOO|nr:hypothetical protein [Uliginosibacterium sp. H3]